ncbi:MAG: hypothetical protein WD602_00855 [Actinomycetota bacterium]
MRTSIPRAVAAGITALMIIALAQPAGAHEGREVGEYEVVVGWAEEPAYTGFPNAAEITLTDSAGEPVADLGADELQVEVLFDDETTGRLPVEPAFGEPGHYKADLVPTRPGTYSFHFTGTINGEPIDETFTSGEDTFAEPQNPAEVGFPAQDPTNGELAGSIEQIRAELASEDSDSSTTGVVGIGIGALALLVALGALLKSRTG